MDCIPRRGRHVTRIKTQLRTENSPLDMVKTTYEKSMAIQSVVTQSLLDTTTAISATPEFLTLTVVLITPSPGEEVEDFSKNYLC